MAANNIPAPVSPGSEEASEEPRPVRRTAINLVTKHNLTREALVELTPEVRGEIKQIMLNRRARKTKQVETIRKIGETFRKIGEALSKIEDEENEIDDILICLALSE